jgi:DNA-binding CsgD family transcriptional regulator/RecA/RadA recombinase
MVELPAQSDSVVRNARSAKAVFIGRQREMAELETALDEALSGRGRVVMLVGEPGIGKTQTSEEMAALAQQRGAAVLWGRCPEERGVPPYWPWAQAIRSYLLERQPEAIQSEMGAGAAEIAEIVAEVKELLPGLKPSPPTENLEQARFRLFDSITSFLKRASQTQPLLLVLDNLHWADPSSCRLLEFVAQELAGARVLLLGTYRDIDVSRGHPLFRTLGELTRQRLYQRVLLRGLSQDEVGQVIAAMGGITPPLQLVTMVHQQTEGNPLFVGEVVRLLAQEGLLATERLDDLKNWDFRLPEGIREVIGRRLDRLSDDCNLALTLASVIGMEFSLDLLGQLSTDQPEGQLLEVLEEALGARVIQELPNTPGHYQFTHALIQETLLEELSLTRRVRLHARTAEALEQLYGDQVEAHAAELAYHFAQAEPVTGPEKLVHYSLLAGERALAAYAWEDALRHFQRALAANGVPLAGTEPAKDAETAALLFGLGRARAGTADRQWLQDAVDTISRAFTYYEAAGDVAQAVAVAEYPLPTALAGRSGVAQFGPQALKLVPPDSLAAGRLLCSYGADRGRVESDYEGAEEAFRRALAIARRENDVSLEVRTLAAAANVDLFHLHFPEALEKATQAIEFVRGLDDPQAMWSAHLDAGRALWWIGKPGAAQQHASAALELAKKLRDRYRLNLVFRLNAILYRHLGDWRRARDFSDRGLAEAPQDNALLSDRVLLEYEVGDFGAGMAYLEQFLETIPSVASRQVGQNAFSAQVIAWVARITGVLDRLEAAESVAQIVLASAFANPAYVLHARAGLGLLAVLRRDVAAALEQYEALQSRRGLMLLEISSDHLLGLLAHTMGQLDTAAEHFEDALALCRKAGLRPELAWTCHDYADMLLNPVGAGFKPAPTPAHQAKAMSLLEEALAITRELGMRPLLERVVLLREQAESQPARAPAYPDGLSQREVEVLRLIALGKSNREIAKRLVITEGTARRHVSNIYNKIGAANRAEATGYALRRGLLSLDEVPSATADAGTGSA